MLLVTGGTGYLGTVLLERLRRDGRRVRAVVRDAARARRLLGPDVELVEVGLGDVDGLTRAARGCSGVLHLAGSVGHCPRETARANVEGTRAVLAAATAAGVGRFVHTSSSAAVFDATGLVAERPRRPPALADPYSASKAAAERLVLSATGGPAALVVNPVGIYGPSPRGPQSYNALFLAAARGQEPAVVDARTGWVLAEDAAAGLLLALERGEPGRRYVLCGEVAPFSRVLHDFADRVGGRRVRVLPRGSALGPDAGTFARRSEVYGRFPAVRVEDGGARALGFRPCGVAAGVARTAAWTGPLR